MKLWTRLPVSAKRARSHCSRRVSLSVAFPFENLRRLVCRCPITGDVAVCWQPDAERAACLWDFEYEFEESHYGSMACVCPRCIAYDRAEMDAGMDWEAEIDWNGGND